MSMRRDQLLTFIRTYFRDHSRGPTFVEMRDALGVSSKATVHSHITSLLRDGLLRESDNWDRRYEPADVVALTFMVPSFIETEVQAAVAAVMARHPVCSLVVRVSVKRETSALRQGRAA